MSEINMRSTDWAVVGFDMSLKSNFFNSVGVEYVVDEIRAFETEGFLMLTSDKMAYDAVVSEQRNSQMEQFKKSGIVHHFVEYKLHPQEMFDFYKSFCVGKDMGGLSSLSLTREGKGDKEKFNTLILCNKPQKLRDFECLLDLYKDSQYQSGNASASIMQRVCIENKRVGDGFSEYLDYEIANATGEKISAVSKVKHKIETMVDTIHDCFEK